MGVKGKRCLRVWGNSKCNRPRNHPGECDTTQPVPLTITEEEWCALAWVLKSYIGGFNCTEKAILRKIGKDGRVAARRGVKPV